MQLSVYYRHKRNIRVIFNINYFYDTQELGGCAAESMLSSQTENLGMHSDSGAIKGYDARVAVKIVMKRARKFSEAVSK